MHLLLFRYYWRKFLCVKAFTRILRITVILNVIESEDDYFKGKKNLT